MTLFSGLDGVVTDADSPLLPATDAAVRHGDGVFETVLVAADVPIDLTQHLVRLHMSAAIMDIALPPDTAWRGAINGLIRAWTEAYPTEPDFVLRLVVSRSGTAFATAARVPETSLAARAGISVILAEDPFNRRAPYLSTLAKSLSYATNMAALRYARSRGADDVIFQAGDGTITEAPTATVVIVHGGQYFSPPSGPETGVLPGITAQRLEPTYRPITAQELFAADAIYLVSAIRLAAPVLTLDGRPLPHDDALTARILRRLIE